MFFHQGVYNFWKYWKSTGIWYFFLEMLEISWNLIGSPVIFLYNTSMIND